MAIKPNRNNKKVFLATAAAILLLLLLALALFSNQDSLFNGKVSVQASTNKQSYVQGENVTILADLVNGKNEPVDYPDSMGFSVEASNGTGVYNITIVLSWGNPAPTLAAHSKVLFHYYSDNATFVWNQKGGFGAFILSPDNYTITVAIGDWTSNPVIIEVRSTP
jgi:hypothetical protein